MRNVDCKVMSKFILMNPTIQHKLSQVILLIVYSLRQSIPLKYPTIVS